MYSVTSGSNPGIDTPSTLISVNEESVFFSLVIFTVYVLIVVPSSAVTTTSNELSP